MKGLRRALTLVALIAIVCIVLLILLLRQLEGYRAPRAPSPPAPAPPTEIHSGTVRFGDGEPAAGATVTTVWDGVAGPVFEESSADSRGWYELPDTALRSGRVQEVTARLGPLLAGGRDAYAEGPAVPHLTFPATFRLAGRVQRGTDRAAVDGARVRCGGVETRSDEHGAFVLDAVPAAAWRDADLAITVEATGHLPLVRTLPRDELPPYYGDLTLLLTPGR